MTHVRTSPYYPQSNGKLERWHKSLKGECIRPGVPLTPEDARRLIERYVEHYNTVRLHSAIGFVTPGGHAGGPPKPRSTPPATASWSRRESNGSCVVGRRFDFWSYNGIAG